MLSLLNGSFPYTCTKIDLNHLSFMKKYLLKRLVITRDFFKSSVFYYQFSITLGNVKYEKINIANPA